MVSHINTTTHIADLNAARNDFKDATIEALRAEPAKTSLDVERSRMAEGARNANMNVYDAGLQRRRGELQEGADWKRPADAGVIIICV